MRLHQPEYHISQMGSGKRSAAILATAKGSLTAAVGHTLLIVPQKAIRMSTQCTYRLVSGEKLLCLHKCSARVA